MFNFADFFLFNALKCKKCMEKTTILWYNEPIFGASKNE